MNILITGATGNIGAPLIRELCGTESGHLVHAAVRDIEKAKRLFPGQAAPRYRTFDFEDPATFAAALPGMDLVFILRPPHISNIGKVFDPFFAEMKRSGVGKAVLLSVQGAEKSDIIPHRKIEKLIIGNGLEYVFVRPSYFMQNLTTTLLDDIRQTGTIRLPAKYAKFNWIDIGDIAELCAIFLRDFEKHKNRAYVVTGRENLDFAHVAGRIRELTGRGISYAPIGPLGYILHRIRRKSPLGMALVTCALHFLPRLQGEPATTETYKEMTGKDPTTIDEFIRENREVFTERA